MGFSFAVTVESVPDRTVKFPVCIFPLESFVFCRFLALREIFILFPNQRLLMLLTVALRLDPGFLLACSCGLK